MLFLATVARGEDRSVEFDGERFVCQYVKVENERSCARYLRDGESLEKWTKMVAVWHFPQLQGTPTEGAAAVIRRLQENQPESKFNFFR